jgi:hypothetical protein
VKIVRLTAQVEAYKAQLLKHGLKPDPALSPSWTTIKPFSRENEPSICIPEEDPWGGEGRGGESGRMIASEQQFVHNAKPIGKQPPFSHELAHEHIVLVPDAGEEEEEAFPTSSELEDLRETLKTTENMLVLMGDQLACKEDELGSLHTSLRNRDTILSQRQAEITAKEAQALLLRHIRHTLDTHKYTLDTHYTHIRHTYVRLRHNSGTTSHIKLL